MAVYIGDLDVLEKLEAVEGPRWRQDDKRMWDVYRSGNTAHAFVFAWNYTHSPEGAGLVPGSPDEHFWKDFFAGEFSIELGIIYGAEGYSRYAVSDEGELVLDAGSTRPEKAELAQKVGFRVPGLKPNPRQDVCGPCFRFAWREALQWTEDGKPSPTLYVVHGTVVDSKTGERHWHAWLERRGWAWDVYANILPVQEYVVSMQVQDVRRYPADHTLRMTGRTGHSGPWQPYEERQASRPNPTSNSLFYPPMPDFLRHISNCVVVVGSVARTIRNPDFELPKDIDLLVDLDSDRCRKKIQRAIERFELQYESPFFASWTFRNYGWMVEIIGIHHGPFYRTVRRRADKMSIAGIELWVAQPEDAPKHPPAP